MGELSPYSDISEGSTTMDFNTDVENNFTPTEPNYLYSLHHFGKLEWSNQSDSYGLIAENVTVQDNFADGVNYPPNMITFGAICKILMGIVAIVSNFISICALSKSKKLNKIIAAFILNLCVANLLLSCCTLTSSVFIYRTQNWNGGGDTCKVYNILIFFFCFVVMFTIIAITLNRYVLIVHPLFYYTMFRMRNTLINIGSVWIISVLMTVLPLFDILGKYGYDPYSGECAVIDHSKDTKIYTFIVKYFISLILILLCYAKIFYVVRKTERKTTQHGSSIMSRLVHLGDKFWLVDKEKEPARASYKELRSKKEWRVFQMIFVIFLCFVLCFIPVTIIKMCRKEREYPGLYIIFHLGLDLSNVVNPVIYVVMNEEYRKAYMELFRGFRAGSQNF